MIIHSPHNRTAIESKGDGDAAQFDSSRQDVTRYSIQVLLLARRRFSQQIEGGFDKHFTAAGLQGGVGDFVAAAGVGRAMRDVDRFDGVRQFDNDRRAERRTPV